MDVIRTDVHADLEGVVTADGAYYISHLTIYGGVQTQYS